MADIAEPSSRRVPPRALVLSVAALAVPVVGALRFPDALGEYGALLWLTALVPAFLMAYYRGWRGVATALAIGMATLSTTQAFAAWRDLQIPDLLLGIVVAYLTISMGIGWVTELLHRDIDVVEDLAFTDILTKLPNRRHARVFLENEFAAAERGHLLAVVLFDLDHFKDFNDRFGHAAGDEALVIFAEILAENTRRMNLSARFGGEEFLAVLAGSDAEGAVTFADRVRTSLRDRSDAAGPLTVSAGVAAYHPSMRSPDELLAAADDALYKAKREGRNCIRLFGGALRDEVPGPNRMETVGTAEPRTGEEGEYPRESAELGKSRPPVTLLPHRITVFGSSRRVLVVEDEEHVRGLISTYLGQEGFHVVEALDTSTGMKELAREFDVVITDIRLPGASGNELVRAVKSRWPATQVIVITGLREADVAAAALNAGADRYLFKPFGMSELRSHLVDALARRDRLQRDRLEKDALTGEALRRAEASRKAILGAARALVSAVEARDPHTLGHAERVKSYAVSLAEWCGASDSLNLESLELGCEVHDVGKICVPDPILNKPGPLSAEEMREVQDHPGTGRRILEPLLEDETVLGIVGWHHERWDGEGYPDGLGGESIPLAARLVAVADALDAMTSPRAFRDAFPLVEAVARIRAGAGTQFDPEIVRALNERLPSLHKLHGQEVGRS